MTDKAIKLAGSDLEVLMDAYNLKGILLYRLGSLIESVNVLYQARRVQKKIKDLRAPSKVNFFEQMLYTDLVIDEMKNIFTSRDYNKALKRSDSFDFKRH